MMMLGKQEDCFALGPWWLLSSVTASIINTDWVLGGLLAEETHIVTLEFRLIHSQRLLSIYVRTLVSA